MAVKLGLIGLGVMGTIHRKAYGTIPQARLTAVCDLDPQRLEGREAPAGNVEAAGEAASLAGVAKFGDYRQLLGEADVDAVDLCVPTDLHAELAVAALRAGKHVFCEKPMAIDSRRARRMAAEADRAGRTLMVGHCLRFWPEYLGLKAMIESGRFGPVRSAVFRRMGGRPVWSSENWYLDARRSGQAALDLHVHDADVVQWFFGPPEAVRSCGRRAEGGGLGHIVTRYLFGDDRLIVAEGGWLHPSYPFFMTAAVEFEAATAEYDSRRTPTLTVYPSSGQAMHPPVPAEDAYAEELRYFVRCVAEGSPAGRVPPGEAARAVAIVEAEVRSAETGRRVSVR